MNVPDGWRTMTLDEVGTWFGGGTPSKSRPEFWDGGTVPWLSPKDMGETRLSGTRDKITDAAVSGSAVRMVPAGAVAFVVRSGILERALPSTLVSFPTTLNQDMKALVPHADIVTPEWLAHAFRAFEHPLLTGTRKAGTTVASLDFGKVKSFQLPVPPLPEQRRIVEIVEEQVAHLDAADASLASAERRISGQLASVRHMAWSEGAHVPLTDVAAIQGGIQKQGKRAPVKNIYPFLRVANVTAQGLDLGDVHRVELFEGELERLRLASGDLLVVEGNGSASQIGRAALWDGSIPDCVHQNHLIRVRADSSKMAPAYLELVWNSPALRAQLTDVASSSSGLHTLSVRKLKTLRVPCPPRSDQERLVTQAAAIVDRQQSLRRSLNYQQQRSAILRRAILAAAFSGRLITRAHAMDPLPGAPADD